MPVILLLMPMLGIIISNILGKKAAQKAAFWTAFVIGIIQIGCTVTYQAAFWRGINTAVNSIIPFGADLKIDLISAVILVTVGLVSILSLWVDRNIRNPQGFNFTNVLFIIIMGMNGIVMVRDIFSVYIFIEIISVSTAILISVQTKKEPLEGALKYLIMSMIASVLILSAIAIVFLTVGAVDFVSISVYLTSLNGVLPVQMTVALVLFAAGFCIKGGLVPFHGWLPDAYSSAPASVSVLLAGVITKTAGLYAIIRFIADILKGGSVISLSLMIIGSASILIGAIAAIGQKDFKRMLAYSSISQMGYIVLSAGLGTPLGITAGMLHFFNHAMFKALLFADSSAVELATGTNDMQKYGGLAARMPITAGTSAVGFLSAAGIPPLAGFWSKLLIIIALWQAGQYVFAGIAIFASLLTLAYMLIMQRMTFFGELKSEWQNIKEGRSLHTVPVVIFAGITVAVGILFPVILLWMQAQGLV